MNVARSVGMAVAGLPVICALLIVTGETLLKILRKKDKRG